MKPRAIQSRGQSEEKSGLARARRWWTGAVALVCFAVLAPVAAFAQPGPPPPPPLPNPPVPAGNPLTVPKIELGKILFWEEQMSSDNTVACGTCHRPEAGGGDPRVVRIPGPDGILGNADDIFGSPGVIKSDAANDYDPHDFFGLAPQVTERATPSHIGAAYFDEMFWDGRAGRRFDDPETGGVVLANGGALENQASGPPLSDVEMAHAGRDWSQITSKLEDVRPLALASNIPSDIATAIADNPTYPDLFAEAFGDPQITASRISMAIASYERTQVPDQTPWDEFNDGDMTALTPAQRAGLQVFTGPGRCVLCHGGALFSDEDFHALGVRPPDEDLGRFEVTGNPADRGRFKTASLRNVGLRPRYMHTGTFDTLGQVVGFYNGGGGAPENRDPALRPLNLSPQQRNNLVDFLGNGLTDPRVAQALPPFDRPTLASERAPNPSLFGPTNGGSGGLSPLMLADAVPAAGNSEWKLGVHQALGGAQAILAFSAAAANPGDERDGIPLNISLDRFIQKQKIVLEGSGPGDGYGTIRLGIPDRSSLIGKTFFAQWFVKDNAATGGLSASQGTAFEIL